MNTSAIVKRFLFVLFIGILSVNYVFSMAAPAGAESSAGSSLISFLPLLPIIAIIFLRKKLLVLSILLIILCLLVFFLVLNMRDSELFVGFLFQYIFVIPYAIVSLWQSIKRKNNGLIIMTSIGFALYIAGLFTAIDGLTSYDAGLVLGYGVYFLSFLFSLALAIVWIVLSVGFLKKKPKEQVEVVETNS